ncbi:plasmid stabilization system [Methanoregula boonei 6A8]|jgi:mRNA interferase RelE/StbE|uniref:Plasmid stabilization system n=1 Tax=Methanoregula boonei (strain DSM 21154 / JCM 14090 / 6A8) TaxID=456442 RepID=A7I9F4_METB6|nr:type II toxin-antitoxin system RelE/ParE family toxin [Methanoregula boonei]ABS56365.1 plasmid stabilization system [Methanoregula boonei 6A8]
MSGYAVRYTHRADRDLGRLPPELARQVIRKIHAISQEPYHHIKKIKGSHPLHPVYSVRIRRGLRAFLSIHDDVLIIHVLEVEYRKSAYRDF